MLAAALLSWFLMGLFIHYSKRFGWGQRVRVDGPQSHLVKDGTPTAGGVAFVVALLVIFLVVLLTGGIAQVNLSRELLILGAMVGMGLVGGVDDFLKIRSRKFGGKAELLAREKFPLQILVALLFAGFAAPLASHELVSGMPRVGGYPLLDMLLMTFVMVGSVNAFNFTDGLDGLLAGVGMIVLLPLIAISPMAALMVAVLLGFLWFNAHPARVFMGDMGSHAIGAVAAGAYMLYSDVWLLPIAAIIPVLAVLSVVIQVVSFKFRKKRVFKMSPIQHHFEEIGWPETHVTLRFWVITGMATALTWFLMGGRP